MHRVGNGYARSELVQLGQLLADRGADPNARHRFGDPPIMEVQGSGFRVQGAGFRVHGRQI